MNNFDLQSALLSLPGLLIAFTVHELCHGLVAYALGDSTAKNDGRLSLNPIKHIDPIGFLMIMLMGFGWAKPVMVNIHNLKNPKWSMALIALAGPVSNLIMAFIGVAVWLSVLFFAGLANDHIAVNMLFHFAWINILLAVFNMLPLPPLDGSKVFTAWLPDDAYFSFQDMLSRWGIPILFIAMLTGVTGRIIRPIMDFILDSMIFAVVWVLSNGGL